MKYIFEIIFIILVFRFITSFFRPVRKPHYTNAAPNGGGHHQHTSNAPPRREGETVINHVPPSEQKLHASDAEYIDYKEVKE